MRAFLCALALLAPADAEAIRLKKAAACSTVLDATLPDPLQMLVKHGLQDVLDEGDRAEFATVTLDRVKNWVLVETKVGTYKLRVAGSRAEVYPRTGMPQPYPSRGKLVGELCILVTATTDWDEVQGLIRSLFRGDRYLNPRLWPHDGPQGKRKLDYPQRKAVDALLAMKSKKNRVRALAAPPGTGKTVIAANFALELGDMMRRGQIKGWKKEPRILYVIQNIPVLDRTVETFAVEMGIAEKDIARMYDEGTRLPLNETARMIAISRSSCLTHLETIKRLLKEDKDQPWIIIFDEAHHLGKVKGEFEKIQAGLDEVCDHRHVELCMSAFWEHRDRALLREHVRGNLHAMHLTETETRRLAQGLDIPAFARKQFLRNVRKGYGAPLEEGQIIREVNGRSMSELLEGENIDRAAGKREVNWYRDLLVDLAERISTLQRNDPKTITRGVIYVDSRARANLYAEKLGALMPEFEVRALHSGAGVLPDTWEWFHDDKAFATAKNRAKPKLLIVVDMLREGADMRFVNLIVLLRAFSEDSLGFGDLLQVIGRGGRTYGTDELFKLFFRLLDYTGYSRWLAEGLAEISVEPMPHSKKPWVGIPYVVVDKVRMDALEFRRRRLELFVEQATFWTRYPTFDRDTFLREAMPTLRRHAAFLQVPGWSTKFGPYTLAVQLAMQLPKTNERETLLSQFDDPELYDWATSDGVQIDQGGDLAARRLYVALRAIAALAQTLPGGDRIDLSVLHTRAGMTALLEVLFPERRPLQGHELAEFTHPRRGAIARLHRERAYYDSRFTTTESTLRMVIEQFDEGPAKERARAALTAEKFSEGDGVVELTGTNESGRGSRAKGVDRIHRVLWAIAESWNEQRPQQRVRPEAIHITSELDKVLVGLRPSPLLVASATDAQLTAFLEEETGGLAELRARLSWFGVTDFVTRYGAQRVVEAAARQLATESVRDELLRLFLLPAAFDWKSNDGNQMATAHALGAARRCLRALQSVATELKKENPLLTLRPEQIHTRRGMETFLDELFLGVALPHLSAARLAQFAQGDDGALQTFLDARLPWQIDRFWRDFGTGRLARAFVGTLGEGALAKRLRHLVENDRWGWNAYDASAAKNDEQPQVNYWPRWRIAKFLLAAAAVAESECDGPSLEARVLAPRGFTTLERFLSERAAP